MLQLDDTIIKGSSLKIAATMTLAGDDMSGQSSSTDVAETGDKPKQLGVQLNIRFIDAKNLTEIITLAEGKDEQARRIAFYIDNPLALAMGIRRVRFLGEVSAREDESLEMWRVSFKLTEVLSVAEAKEARVEGAPASDQPPTGEATTPEEAAAEAELTTLEKYLKKADEWIGAVAVDDET